MSWLPPSPARIVQPPWEENSFESSWSAITSKAVRLQEGVAHGPGFTDRKAQARKLLEAGDVPALQEAVTADRYLYRAVAALWTEDPALAVRTLRKGSLAAAFGDSRLNRLTVHSLIALLLRDFTRLESWEASLFDYFASLVQWASTEIDLPTRTQRHLVHTVQHHPEWLLTTDAPTAVVDHLEATGTDLEAFLTDIGLRGSSGGTYGESIRRARYLKRLSEADPAGDDPVLHEVRSRDVYEAPTADGGYFGQQILDILCSPTASPGTPWLDTLLHIAGDPRLTHSTQWVTWWSGVLPQVRQKVIGWLSSEDLRLFLGAVEEYAKREDDDDILRMFPARRTFLEGLLDMGLVQETRLFMGARARSYVQWRFKRDVLSDITRISHPTAKSTSVIYVNCGSFHFVEGSHNFRLWIYAGDPAPLLTDRSNRVFPIQSFRKDVPRAFLTSNSLSQQSAEWELDTSPRHKALSHQGLWQKRTLDFLDQLGIHIPADRVMDSAGFKEYRRQVGPARRISTVGLTAAEMSLRQGRRR